MATFNNVVSAWNALSATSLNSLASAGSWYSAAVAPQDSYSRIYDDVIIDCEFETASGTIGSASPQVTVYIAPVNADGTYVDGVGGSGPGTLTPRVASNSPLLGFVAFSAAAELDSMTFSLKAALGFIPSSFVIWLTNSSGLALASSGNAMKWAGVQRVLSTP